LALTTGKQIDAFPFRLSQQLRDGGFVAVTGDPGTGKSAALRLCAARIESAGDLKVGILSRPQSNNADFYRELGDLFGVSLSPHNRWAGSKALRQQWLAHIDKSRCKPVLIIDEAQEMKPAVFAELRIRSAAIDAGRFTNVLQNVCNGAIVISPIRRWGGQRARSHDQGHLRRRT
jgi:general secretion pathway protein A